MNPQVESRARSEYGASHTSPPETEKRAGGVQPLVAAPASSMILSNTSATLGPVILEVVLPVASASMTVGAATLLEVPINKPMSPANNWPGGLAMLMQGAMSQAVPAPPPNPWLFCGVAVPPATTNVTVGGQPVPASITSLAASQTPTAGATGFPAGIAVKGAMISNTGNAVALGNSGYQLNIILVVQAAGVIAAGTRIILVSIGGQ